MSELHQIFPPNESQHLWDLHSDKDCRHLVRQQIGSKLLSFQDIIEDHPLEQLFSLLSLAVFADSEYECIRVGKMMWNLMKQPDILPLVTRHQGMDLASRCLLSLSLFMKALSRRCERYGAPSPEFYRGVGKKTFKSCDLPALASHFDQWQVFIGEIFRIEE